MRPMNLLTRNLGLGTLLAGVLCINGTNPQGAARAQTSGHSSTTEAGETTQAKVARAMSAGPAEVTKSARIVDTDSNGKTVVLREGNNGFTCMPGESEIHRRSGDVRGCCVYAMVGGFQGL